jgi:sulfotransferase family protein
MTLPTFVGIGVPRAGTTWLHTMLDKHPETYLPGKRKEVRFFDRYFDEGLGWYETFFRDADPNARAVGEISPQYFYCDACPARIAATLPHVRLLLMLRHPVDRAYSHYGFVMQRRNFRGTFRDFLESRPKAIEMSLYTPPLEAYLLHFRREQILPLLFDRTVKDGADSLRALAAFLEVDPDGFPTDVGRVNASTLPQHPGLADLAVRTGRKLRRFHLEPLVDVGRRLGVGRIWSNGTPIPKLDPQERGELTALFDRDIDALERRLTLDLSHWRG